MPENQQTKEKVIVYLGPSLSLKRAKEILPEAIYRPPAKQGDILSDIVNVEPDYVILIDGEFRQNLSPWHKEICHAVQYPGLTGIYGAASMGALRASECDIIGMVGVGKIYGWYRDGVTEDDSEVALSYTSRESDEGLVYYPLTVPLCDIRAGMVHYQTEFPDQPIAAESRRFFESMQKVHYMDRTQQLCEQVWENKLGASFPHVPQKAIDAIHVLQDFRTLKPEPIVNATPEDLTVYFNALYDRDRRILINGQEVPQQHIDSYVLLHNPEWERICWDSSNQELALILCNALCVTVSVQEIERENQRFQGRCGIETISDFDHMLENNGWSRAEYDRLVIQNARIHKLQHALTASKLFRRNTCAIIDYLRTHQAFDYWAVQAAQLEAEIKKRGVDDWLNLDLDTPAFSALAQHFEKEGLELTMLPEEYLLETGFANLGELGVALARVKAGREQI
jgi:hypothetical protein